MQSIRMSQLIYSSMQLPSHHILYDRRHLMITDPYGNPFPEILPGAASPTHLPPHDLLCRLLRDMHVLHNLHPGKLH